MTTFYSQTYFQINMLIILDLKLILFCSHVFYFTVRYKTDKHNQNCDIIPYGLFYVHLAHLNYNNIFLHKTLLL